MDHIFCVDQKDGVSDDVENLRCTLPLRGDGPSRGFRCFEPAPLALEPCIANGRRELPDERFEELEPVNVLAGAQVMMSVPNFYRLEARRVKLGFYNAFLEEPLDVVGDALIVPKRPGLGARLDLAYLGSHQVE